MMAWLERLKKLRFYLAMGILNVVSVGTLLYYNNPQIASSSHAAVIPTTKKEIKKETVAGRPVLVKIPSLALELPVDEGYYNPADATWTLSGYRAHFAMPTMLANNQEGNTLVYGHNNKHVFGPLKGLQPGAVAEIRTDNGHVFYYTFESNTNVQPDDLSVFTYEGAPILTLQTCTGNWHELRMLSRFNLTRVVKYNPNAERDEASRKRLMSELNNLSSPSYPQTPIIR